MRFYAPTIRQGLLYSLLSFVSVTIATYADEAYKIDYHHALLGTPLDGNTFFHQPSSTSKASLLYTLSERGVIGAVNPKDGELVWRQWLPFPKASDDPDFSGRMRPEGGSLTASEGLLFSTNLKEVAAWDAADGRHVWRWRAEGSIHDLEVLKLANAPGNVVALSSIGGKSQLTSLRAVDGAPIWQASESGYDWIKFHGRIGR